MKPNENTSRIRSANAMAAGLRGAGQSFKPTVARCGCSSSFQDCVYGPGMRLKNARKREAKETTTHYRCTVCGVVS